MGALVRTWPHSVGVRCVLGALYMRFGHVQAACGHWEAALRAKPMAVEPRLRLFRALAATGETERTARELESLLSLKPGESRTYLAAGEFYYAIGNRQLRARIEACVVARERSGSSVMAT